MVTTSSKISFLANTLYVAVIPLGLTLWYVLLRPLPRFLFTHPFHQQQVDAQVSWGRAQVEKALEVSGYQISGAVLSSEGMPMQGAQVELFSDAGR